MFWNLEAMRDYGLRATDGDIGQITDVLLDDASWSVRYVVVDTGNWLPGRKVLIPPTAFGEPDTATRAFPVDLTRDQVKHSPDIDCDRPVGRQQEEALYGHYGWAPYWGGPAAPMWGAPMAEPVPADYPATMKSAAERDPSRPEDTGGDPHLRSAREIEGYAIEAEDGSIGHVQDFLIGHDWRIRYLVIDTRNWLPGRKVVVPPDWVRRIDWANRQVDVDLTREQVKSSPEYDPLVQLDRGFEEQLYGYYGRVPYWI